MRSGNAWPMPRRLLFTVPFLFVIAGAVAYLTDLPPFFSASIAAPDQTVAESRAVQLASRSEVNIFNQSCRINGSGWIAAPGLVVTDAHVVAGEPDPLIPTASEDVQLSAQVVAFDPGDDLAVLYAPGVSGPALALAAGAGDGQPAALLTDRQSGAQIVAVRAGSTKYRLTSDIFGSYEIRQLTELRGTLEHGYSGAAVLSAAGRVIGDLYSLDPRQRADQVGYASTTAQIADALRRARALKPASTGTRCVNIG